MDLLGQGGDITGAILISTGTLSLEDGAVLNTSTYGTGNAGAVVVVARDDVSIEGGGIGSVAGETATGDAGAILMSVGSLSIASTADYNSGLTTETFGEGNAGFVYVLADEDISIQGGESSTESGIASRVEEGSAYTSGLIYLEARSLFLRGEGAKVTVSNQGSGLAGDIAVVMREDIILRDEAEISAIANSGEGGNIFLTSGDFLVLVNNSGISAQAGSVDRPGGINGGNIAIDTRYLIAAPFSSNDLDAEAFEGQGGRIEIDANRLYDIEERSRSSLSNDISVTSGYGPPGQVTSNVLNADPTQGLANLPANPIDPTTLIAETCAPIGSIEDRDKNTFTVTERGGLPPDPNAAFPGEAVVNDLETPAEAGENTPDDPNSTNVTSPAPVATASPQEPELVEAQGWLRGENGNIIFTAQASVVTPNNSIRTPASTCHVSTSPQ
ncbi:MAG: S-layer family protein [Microcoleus sp. SIO2G3]|nr:S-layer family protein [Microcoleus sp. SIO2G3]